MNDQVKYYGLMLTVGLLVFFIHLDLIPVNIMEARNFITAREMADGGHWLLTKMNGLPRYEKPPLPTWLAAFSGIIFGFDRIAALRLPSAFASLVLIFFVYRLSVKIGLANKHAFINALICSTSFYVIFAGRNGTWDIFAHSSMIVGIYFLYDLMVGRNNAIQNALLAGLFMGVSFLSKGPIAHYALLLPFLIAVVTTGKLAINRKKTVAFLVLLVVTLVVSAWWGFYVYLMDQDSLSRIADKETFAWSNRSVKPFYHYWSFFIQSGLWSIPALMSLVYPYMKSRVSNLKVYQFTLLWTLASVVLLSLIPEKKERYLMPVMIPLALNTGFYVDYLFREFKSLKSRLEKVPVWLHFGILIISGIAFPVALYLLVGDRWMEERTWAMLLTITLMSLGIAMFFMLRRFNVARAFYLSIAFEIAVIVFGFPMTNVLLVNPQYSSMKELNLEARKQNVPVYYYEHISPEMVWDFGDSVPSYASLVNSEEKMPDQYWVLCPVGREHEFSELLDKDVNIDVIDTIDINPNASTKGGYRDRLTATVLNLDSK